VVLMSGAALEITAPRMMQAMGMTRIEPMSPPHSLQDEFDRHSEPDGNGLIAPACRFEAPLLDGFRGRQVKVGVTGGGLDLDLPYPTVLQHLKEQGCDAGDTLASRGLGVSW
jgi:hypothetical protein